MDPKIFTIPADAPFLKDLALGVFDLAEGPGPNLARFRIMLPTRRAVRELRETFLNLSDRKPLLLPRIFSLNDIDEEELDLLVSGSGMPSQDDLPPALSSLERQVILTKLIQKAYPDKQGEKCLTLARALGSTMDEIYNEELDLNQLPYLVEIAELAEHWSKTIEFLQILSVAWPEILREKGMIDAADRRNRILKKLAAYWTDHPPSTPVIAAGTMGAVPAARALLKTILSFPQGYVILPGLDRDMDDESWKQTGDTHPQILMKELLKFLGLHRDQVSDWKEHSKIGAAIPLIRAMTCPAETCGIAKLPQNEILSALENIELIEAENPRQEAQAIALTIREMLETPDKTAIVVTPDRNLARRISSALKRWNISVDDSAGQPLHMRPMGIFFGRIINCIVDEFAPTALLDLLKSQFVSQLFPASYVGALEQNILRGARPAPGLAGLENRITKIEDTVSKETCNTVINRLHQAFIPLLSLPSNKHSFSDFLDALVSTAEKLSGGPDILWKETDGHDLSGLIVKLKNISHHLPSSNFWTHRNYLMRFMADCMIRPAYGTHPRIAILGQIEARLLNADLKIIAGLNEGSWPLEPDIDPWMSRSMRNRFQLPSKNRETGISAHDFAQAFCGDKVIMTRSLHVDGTPMTKSRWLQRLEAILKQANLEPAIRTKKYHDRWSRWLAELDQPLQSQAFLMPEPKPPSASRPNALSVTQIEALMKNPYRIYADKILKLKPLAPIDEDVTASERGSFVHDVLNQFVSKYPDKLPANSVFLLREMGKEKLDELEQVSPAWHYWWPRFENLSEAFIDVETNWRMGNCPKFQEIKGAHEFDFNGSKFTLTARADRIDEIKDGGYTVIDYKTGTEPSISNIINGKACQLTLEALLITKGGFAGLKKSEAEDISLFFWVLAGKEGLPIKTRHALGKQKASDLPQVIKDSETGLGNLVVTYLSDATPLFPVAPTGQHIYDDEKAYKHLARCDEWGVTGDEDQAEDQAA